MILSSVHIFQLCSFSFLLSCGQILFKLAATDLPPITSINGIFSLFLNYWFWSAMLLYGTATLLWIIILQQVPLSRAYPFAALGFVVVPLVSWVLFKEPLNFSYAIGVFLIIVGLGIIATTVSR